MWYFCDPDFTFWQACKNMLWAFRAKFLYAQMPADGSKYKVPWPLTDILDVERDIYPPGPLGQNESLGQVVFENMQGDPKDEVRVQFWNGDDLMMKWDDLKLVGGASFYKYGNDIAKQKKREARLGLNKKTGAKLFKWVENHGF